MKTRYGEGVGLKKVFTGIMFFVSCVLDTYTLTLLIRDIQFDEVVILFAIISTVTLISLCFGLASEMYKIKKLGNICIDDIDLTVISQKNITRKKIGTLRVNTIQYRYEFSENGFDAYIRFKGEVVKKFGTVKGISLNFSGDSNQTFKHIDAYAYDLIYDPQKKYKIMGKSGENGGLNKEVFFKFQYPLRKNERFDYLFHYRWDNCVNPDKDYIAAIPPFKNINPRELFLEVIFKDKRVRSFETYSINNYTVEEEERVKPVNEDGYQKFSYRYLLKDEFNFAVAVFVFE